MADKFINLASSVKIVIDENIPLTDNNNKPIPCIVLDGWIYMNSVRFSQLEQEMDRRNKEGGQR